MHFPLSPANQRLIDTIEGAHDRAMLGTLYVDLITIHVNDFQTIESQVEIATAIGKLSGLAGNAPRVSDSVRSYFSAAAGKQTVRFDPYEIEATSAHDVAYRLFD